MYTALVGGLLACMVLIWRKSFWRGLSYSLAMFVRWKKPVREEERDEGEDEAGASFGTVPYGLAIVCGCLMTIFFSGRY
jgi:hypothetical protein